MTAPCFLKTLVMVEKTCSRIAISLSLWSLVPWRKAISVPQCHDAMSQVTLGVFKVNADLPFFLEPPVRVSISCLSPLRTATAASTSVDAAPLVRNCLMVPSCERISSANTCLRSAMTEGVCVYGEKVYCVFSKVCIIDIKHRPMTAIGVLKSPISHDLTVDP